MAIFSNKQIKYMVVHAPVLLHRAMPWKGASGQLIHTTGPSVDKMGTNLQDVVMAPWALQGEVQGHASRAGSPGCPGGDPVGDPHAQCHDRWWQAPQNHTALSLH